MADVVQDWGPGVKGRGGLRLVVGEGCEIGEIQRRLNPMDLIAAGLLV